MSRRLTSAPLCLLLLLSVSQAQLQLVGVLVSPKLLLHPLTALPPGLAFKGGFC